MTLNSFDTLCTVTDYVKWHCHLHIHAPNYCLLTIIFVLGNVLMLSEGRSGLDSVFTLVDGK